MSVGQGTDLESILPTFSDNQKTINALPGPDGPPLVGQVIFTVVPEVLTPWYVFDAERSDQISHRKVYGQARSYKAGVDFRQKKDRLPIYTLSLKNSEELLFATAKQRPCVVLAKSGNIADIELPPADRNIARKAFNRPAYLVAPAYAVGTFQEPRSVTPTIAARAQCLVYPQMMYLPKTSGGLRYDGVVRLDRAFWTTLPPPTECCAITLSGERLEVLRGQLQVLQGIEPGPDYEAYVELLREQLDPKDAQHLP